MPRTHTPCNAYLNFRGFSDKYRLPADAISFGRTNLQPKIYQSNLGTQSKSLSYPSLSQRSTKGSIHPTDGLFELYSNRSYIAPFPQNLYEMFYLQLRKA
jgi:hypothetical protein